MAAASNGGPRRMSATAEAPQALASERSATLGGTISFAEYASHSTLIEQARQECAAHPEGCHLQLNFDVK